jgi:histidyl-tRNA synthetase
MASLEIKAPKGAKDILPEDIPAWNYVERTFADICRSFGFQEIRTPVFEQTELFARGVGDTSDIVQKQMYTFDDLGGRSITLRPEGTAGVVRAFIENKVYAAPQPTKLWYEISCYRYEKPQSGRLREFHQFGVEVYGSADMLADAEVIALADTFLRRLGLNNFSLHINSIGCPECRAQYRDALKAFFAPKFDELCDTCKSRYETNPMRLLDCKSPVCQKLGEGAPLILDYICEECAEAFADLQRNLSALGIAYEIDAGIVRGLDYYTKTAFEFVSDAVGAQGTLCGGGRYDKLIEEIGGPDMPGVGFGLGIERLLLAIEAAGAELPAVEGPTAFIVYIGDKPKAAALKLATRLRAGGISVLLDDMGRGVKPQMKYADRSGARYTIIIGDDELAEGAATLRDMGTGEQERVPIDDVENRLLRSQ